MTTENVTINLEFGGEVSDSQRELLGKLFAGTEAQNEQCCGEPDDCPWDDDAGRLNGFPDSIWAQQKPEPQPEKTVAAQIIEWADDKGIKFLPWQEDLLHRAFIGWYPAQPERDAGYNGTPGANPSGPYLHEQERVGLWWTPDYVKPEGVDVSDHQPEPETCCVDGCDEPVYEPEKREGSGVWWNGPQQTERGTVVDEWIHSTRGLLGNLVEKGKMDERTAQYVLEADQALEDAQIHIADQAERVALQAEEDEIVAEWRIAILQASPVTASNIADWDMMAEDTKQMWRDRFYGNMEWLENFAKGDK